MLNLQSNQVDNQLAIVLERVDFLVLYYLSFVVAYSFVQTCKVLSKLPSSIELRMLTITKLDFASRMS